MRFKVFCKENCKKKKESHINCKTKNCMTVGFLRDLNSVLKTENRNNNGVN